MKANIVKYGLVELASEVGMDIKEPFGERPDWSARVSHSTNQSMQCTMPMLYFIGNKLSGFDMEKLDDQTRSSDEENFGPTLKRNG
ncbi:hypothetical protein CFP56_026081 [Quercus suber]|uniref:Uncharacterized protein n=1 Tax=Quercus suber TaxID=58331 RepID=A0AAW0K257_QUESU